MSCWPLKSSEPRSRSAAFPVGAPGIVAGHSAAAEPPTAKANRVTITRIRHPRATDRIAATTTGHDMDAVEQALQAFLRYEFGGKHPANPSPANPIGQIPMIPPVPTVSARAPVTEHGQRALNELVLEGILIALVRSGVLSAPAAVSVIDGVIETAVRRQLFGGAVEGARFARESLLYEFGRLGLVSSSR